MDRREEINKLKKEIEMESQGENPDMKKIQKLTLRIAHLGIGLDVGLFNQKPFINV